MSKAREQQPKVEKHIGPTPEDIEIREGGTEDLMVKGNGGTLPLKDAEAPDYYSKSLKGKE